nr:M56 family metallopeptidase [Paenibacillus sp. UNC451MF]
MSLFYWVCSVSTMASVLVLLILVMKLVLRNRLKPRWHYLMWLLVILRLILPWGPESELSIYNWIGYTNSIHSAPQLNHEAIPTGVAVSESAAHFIYRNLFILWLVGVCVLGTYTIWVNRKFAQKIKRGTVAITDARVLEIFAECKARMSVNKPIVLVESRHLATPTLFGLVKPQLIMPQQISSSLNNDQLRHVFLHELAHSKRNDIGVNWFMHVLLIIHWFNPVLWYAYRRMREDQEIASDALALSCLAADQRQDYGYTLIKLLESFSQPVRVIGNVNLTGSRTQLQRRIKMIKQYKSNSYRWSFLGIATIVFISGCTLTSPKVSSTSTQWASSTVSEGKAPAGSTSEEQQSTATDEASKQAALGEQQSTVSDDTSKQEASSGAQPTQSDDMLKQSTSVEPQPMASNDKPKQAQSEGAGVAGTKGTSRQSEAARPLPAASSDKPRLVPTEGAQESGTNSTSRQPEAVSPLPTASNDTPRPAPSVRAGAKGSEDTPRVVPSAEAPATEAAPRPLPSARVSN